MNIHPRQLEAIRTALLAVIDEYGDDDYAEGDSHSVRLCRTAVSSIEMDPSKHVGLEDRIEGDHCITICIGCGAKWKVTDEIDAEGHDYAAFTPIEAGDGSCA